MKKLIAVLGLGKFGTSIVEECYDIGCEVLAVDINKERVQAVSPYATYCAQVDVRDKESLRSLGISNVDAVVVAITGDLESSILGTLNVKELGIQQIIAKVKDETQSTILKRIGATDTIIPEKEAGINMARRLASQNILEYIELSQNISMAEVPVRKEWSGHTLRELNLRGKYHINVIALRRNGELLTTFGPDDLLTEDLTMLLIAEQTQIERLTR